MSLADQALIDLCAVGAKLSQEAGCPAELYQMERGWGVMAAAPGQVARYVSSLGPADALLARRACQTLSDASAIGDGFDHAAKRLGQLGFGYALAQGGDAVYLALPTPEALEEKLASSPARVLGAG